MPHASCFGAKRKKKGKEEEKKKRRRREKGTSVVCALCFAFRFLIVDGAFPPSLFLSYPSSPKPAPTISSGTEHQAQRTTKEKPKITIPSKTRHPAKQTGT